MWLFSIKGGCKWYGSVFSPKTFECLGHLKHTQAATCLVHSHGWSLLPSTVLHLCFNFMCAVHCIHLSIPEKPGSAMHSSTSTTSAGLQYLSVGARVHLVWLKLQVIMCDHLHMPTSSGANWSSAALNVSLSPPQM